MRSVKAVLTGYFLLNFLDFYRTWFYYIFLYVFIDPFGEEEANALQSLGFVTWFHIALAIQIALIVTFIMALGKTVKPFLVVIAIDFLAYTLMDMVMVILNGIEDVIPQLCIYVLHGLLLAVTYIFFTKCKNYNLEKNISV